MDVSFLSFVLDHLLTCLIKSQRPDHPLAVAQLGKLFSPDALLLQTEHFAASQKANRLLETPEFRFLALGGLNPCEIPPALRGRQRFESAHGWRVLP
jgi:hypothetical protein